MSLSLSLFGLQYNGNIKYCQLCSTGTSRIETVKYNTHDKRNIIMTDDLHVPVTSAEFSIIQVNMTKTKYNNVIYYCICLSNVIKD